jgi:hypothetical protein
MRKCKKISLFLVLTEILLMLTFILRIGNVIRYNEKVTAGYIHGNYLYQFIPSIETDHPYMRNEDLQKADLVEAYLPDRAYLALYMPGWKDVSFTLKNTLTYYSQPSIFSTKAVSIKKGSICFDDYKLENRSGGIYEIYGFRSWPSYKKGWRIVVPFATEETIEQYRQYEIITPYYVKTEDLYRAFTDYRGEDTEKVYWDFYEKDKLLYQWGYFFSNDFKRSIWNRYNIILITMMIITSLTFIVHRIRYRRFVRKKQTSLQHMISANQLN